MADWACLLAGRFSGLLACRIDCKFAGFLAGCVVLLPSWLAGLSIWMEFLLSGLMAGHAAAWLGLLSRWLGSLAGFAVLQVIWVFCLSGWACCWLAGCLALLVAWASLHVLLGLLAGWP